MHTSLSAIDRVAVRKHADGDHATEHRTVEAMADAITAQRGKGFGTQAANRFLAWCADLVSSKQ